MRTTVFIAKDGRPLGAPIAGRRRPGGSGGEGRRTRRFSTGITRPQRRPALSARVVPAVSTVRGLEGRKRRPSRSIIGRYEMSARSQGER